MNVFTQLVAIVGRITPGGVAMLGTAFMVRGNGTYVTTRHVAGSEDSNLVVLAPHVRDINEFQDLSDTTCQTLPARISEMDPIRDLVLLDVQAKFDGPIPDIGSFDDDSVGDPVGIFGFPHCIHGRRVLTYQRAEIGAKVALNTQGVRSKHTVINTQARPGQSGSMIFSPRDQTISGILVGAWVPGEAGIRLGNIDPQELHQTTHCISAEYVKDML